MKIENLKELKQLIRLCRSEGVQVIKVDGIELGLGAKPQSAKATAPNFGLDMPPEAYAKITLGQIPLTGEVAAPESIDTDSLTDDQLLFYSVAENQSLS